MLCDIGMYTCARLDYKCYPVRKKVRVIEIAGDLDLVIAPKYTHKYIRSGDKLISCMAQICVRIREDEVQGEK